LNRQHYFIAVCNALWRPLLVFVYDDFVVFLTRSGFDLSVQRYFWINILTVLISLLIKVLTSISAGKTLFLFIQTAVCSTVGLAHYRINMSKKPMWLIIVMFLGISYEFGVSDLRQQKEACIVRFCFVDYTVYPMK
jgi:hypothetical protein